MQWYKADLHIHTVLSPCGGLDMSPVNIIRTAIAQKLDIIGITDHNSLKHCRSAIEIGRKEGIMVLAGAEVNTSEEIHCLTFFENIDKAEEFQRYIDVHLKVVKNKPQIFGNQYIVDENENILGEEERLLIAALNVGIDKVAMEVGRLNGIFIPAHINRGVNSLYSQLGFFPDTLKPDAVEISPVHGYRSFIAEHLEIETIPVVMNSDAHILERIGEATTGFFIEKPSFSEIIQAIAQKNGRKTCTQ